MIDRCPCAPDESGNIVHNRWWHDSHDPDFPPDPHTYASTEDVMKALAKVKARHGAALKRLAEED